MSHPDDVHPRALRLEASTVCQLRCPSCPTTQGKVALVAGRSHLQFADFASLVDRNPAIQVIELSNYGEVFLNPQLVDIFRYAHEHRVALTIGNGANLNTVQRDTLEALVRYQVRTLTVSIDGASQETYSQYRVRGNFDRVIDNIRIINECKKKLGSPWPSMVWQFVVFGHNEHEIELARELANELGMRFLPKLTWDEDLSPIQDEEKVKRDTGLPYASRSEFQAKDDHHYMESLCMQLWNNPQINWDGKNLGCCFNFWGDFGGNAFRDGLGPTLNNERMRHARQMLMGRADARGDIPCSTCSIYAHRAATGSWVKPQDLRHK